MQMGNSQVQYLLKPINMNKIKLIQLSIHYNIGKSTT